MTCSSDAYTFLTQTPGEYVAGVPKAIFQSGALFPHKTVAENVIFGLRMRGVARSEAEDRVRLAIDLVQLGGLEDRYPAQLSGGQKQRVALARSMAVRPAILLFDEPLSALDLSPRLQLRAEIKRIHDELGFTAIYVTHDQGEAMAMSSRIGTSKILCRGFPRHDGGHTSWTWATCNRKSPQTNFIALGRRRH